MTKIQVLKKIEYKECPIYIRRLDKVFEFLLIYKNEMYSHYVDIKPKWYKQLNEEPYTPEQLKNIIQLLIKGAETTIDKLNAKK